MARLTVGPIGFYPWVPWDRFQYLLRTFSLDSHRFTQRALVERLRAVRRPRLYLPSRGSFFFWPFTWLSLDRAEFAWTLMTFFSLSAAVACALSRVTSASRVTLFTLALWLGVLGAAVFEPVEDCLAWAGRAPSFYYSSRSTSGHPQTPSRGSGPVATAVKFVPRRNYSVLALAARVKPALTLLASFAITTG